MTAPRSPAPRRLRAGPRRGRGLPPARAAHDRPRRGLGHRGGLSIVDHRVPPGYAPPAHRHRDDEAFSILEGDVPVRCGAQSWQAGTERRLPVIRLAPRQDVPA